MTLFKMLLSEDTFTANTALQEEQR